MKGVFAATLAVLLVLQITGGVPTTHAPSQGVVGARKLATSNDCASVVAFSGVGAKSGVAGPLNFHGELLDKGVGWSKDSGEFTCHCPGLYQFSFAGGAKLTLKSQKSGSTDWSSVVSTSGPGGSNSVLLDLEVGDKTSVWLHDPSAKLPSEDAKDPSSTFSGYRIAKK